jgi:hypothetical protein
MRHDGISVWAPSKLVLDAVHGPEGHVTEPLALAHWLAGAFEARAVLEIGPPARRCPAGESAAQGRVRSTGAMPGPLAADQSMIRRSGRPGTGGARSVKPASASMRTGRGFPSAKAKTRSARSVPIAWSGSRPQELARQPTWPATSAGSESSARSRRPAPKADAEAADADGIQARMHLQRPGRDGVAGLILQIALQAPAAEVRPKSER